MRLWLSRLGLGVSCIGALAAAAWTITGWTAPTPTFATAIGGPVRGVTGGEVVGLCAREHAVAPRVGGEGAGGALAGEHTRVSGRFAGVDFEAVCAPIRRSSSRSS